MARCSLLLAPVVLAGLLQGQTPVLHFSTNFGAYGGSAAQAVAYGTDGSQFVAGYTDAADFPVVAPGRGPAGGVEVVVMKLAPGGAQVLWSTYLGGAAEERALALAPDGLGGVYVAGFTTSSNFPTLSPRQAALKGARDAFLTRITATGAIAFSTYFGGAGSETAYALASDATGVWMAGVTDSTDLPRVAAYQAALKGRQDGFFARFTPAGTLVSSSYAGASGDDIIRSAALGPGGVLVLGGGTDSPDWGFAGGFQPALKGDQDGFLLKFDAAGAIKLGGTYLGGSGGLWTTQETVYGVGVTPDGLIWAGGATPSQDFPRNSSWRTASTDLQDAYLVQFDGGLNNILISSLAGGSQRDSVLALTVDSDGTLYAAGFTTSPDFRVVTPTQSACGGSRDAFVLRWPKLFPAPDFATCLGGRGSDTAQGIAVEVGSVLVGGISDSSNFPQVKPLQPIIGSNAKVFVTEYRNMKSSGMPIQVNTPAPSSGQGGARTFKFSATHAAGASNITHIGFALSPDSTLRNACAVRYVAATSRVELADASGAFTSSVRLRSSEVASNSACVVSGAGATVSTSGNLVEVSVPLVLLPAFAGVKNILVSAQGGFTIEPVVKGSWTVPPANTAPLPVSAALPDQGGVGGTFTFTIADAQGAADLTYGYILINRVFDGANACMIVVDHQWKSLYLANDAVTAWLSVGLGESRTISNSQCRVNGAASRMTIAGALATYVLDIRFTTKNTGVNSIWVDAGDKAGLRPGFSHLDSYEVKVPVQTLSVGTPQPASGQGNVQSFTFNASYTTGASAITESAISISPGATPTGGCTVRYQSATGALQLADLTGAYKWTVRPGTTDIATGPVCTLYGAASTVVKSGANLDVTAALVFPASFSGLRNILQTATAGTALAWQSRGTWTVLSGNSSSGVLRLAPSAAAGSSLSFDMILADAQGKTDVAFGYGLINSSFVPTNACMFLAERTWKAVYLLNDAGTVWNVAFLGEDKILENSQCRIQVRTSTQADLGEATRFRLDVSFKPAFAGSRKLWGSAVDASMLSSAWTEFATITAQ